MPSARATIIGLVAATALVPAVAHAVTPEAGYYDDPRHLFSMATDEEGDEMPTSAQVKFVTKCSPDNLPTEAKDVEITANGRLRFHGRVKVLGTGERAGRASIKGRWRTPVKVKGKVKHERGKCSDKLKFTAKT
jgi:hypothetical protein